jgi:hypothetical protein
LLSAKRRKITLTSNKEMGGKYENVTGHLDYCLTERMFHLFTTELPTIH